MKIIIIITVLVLLFSAACIAEDNTDGYYNEASTEDTFGNIEISIDTSKIDLYIGRKYGTDDFSALNNKYPDIVEIDYQVLNVDFDYFTTWQSGKSGMVYKFYFWGSDGENYLAIINGELQSLITGLKTPVEINEAMDLLELPRTDWMLNEPPSAKIHPEYNPGGFWDVQMNDVCIIIPDDITEDYTIGIKIRPTVKGYLSPNDYFEIRMVGCFV